MCTVQVIFALIAFSVPLAEGVTIDVDYSKAPELANYAGRVKSALEDWFPKIVRILTSPGYTPPTKIPVFFDPNYDGVAYAKRGRIVGGVKYYKGHQDSVGSMIYEMTHVIQAYRNCPEWLTEGIADYVRYYHYEPNKKPGKPGSQSKYTDGFGVSAYFLNYVIKNSKVDLIYYLNKDCREGTYADTIWTRMTGKTLDQHWAAMMK